MYFYLYVYHTYIYIYYILYSDYISDKANAEVKLGKNVWELEGDFISLGPEMLNLICERISLRYRVIKLSF